MVVEFGILFAKELARFPQRDQEKIYNFVMHVQKNGLNNLEGLNKESHHVNKDHHNFIEHVTYAISHNLWHYHIGVEEYDATKPYGYRTSEYVLHYIKRDDSIKIVDFSSHPPFKLPKTDYLV